MADLNELKFAAPEAQDTFENLCQTYRIQEFPDEYYVEEVLVRPQRYRELILDLARYVPYAFKYEDIFKNMLDNPFENFPNIREGALELLLSEDNNTPVIQTRNINPKTYKNFLNTIFKSRIPENITLEQINTILLAGPSSTRLATIVGLFREPRHFPYSEANIYPIYIDHTISHLLRLHTLPLIPKK